MLNFGIFIDTKSERRIEELKQFIAKLRQQFPGLIPVLYAFDWAIADNRGVVTFGTLFASSTYWRPRGEFIFGSSDTYMKIIDEKIDYHFKFRLTYTFMTGSFCAQACAAAAA